MPVDRGPPHAAATGAPEFRKRYANVRLKIIEGADPVVESRLRDGSVDLYIGPLPDSAPGREFVLEKLFDNTRAVFARKGHPLADAGSPADLAGAQWMTTGITDKAESELAQFFARHQLPPPHIAVQCDSMLPMLVTLKSTDVLAITARQLAEFPLIQGVIQAIETRETMAAPPIVIIRRAALPLTPAAEYLCDMFRRASAHYTAGDGSGDKVSRRARPP